jgi:hypothetical protein
MFIIASVSTVVYLICVDDRLRPASLSPTSEEVLPRTANHGIADAKTSAEYSALLVLKNRPVSQTHTFQKSVWSKTIFPCTAPPSSSSLVIQFRVRVTPQDESQEDDCKPAGTSVRNGKTLRRQTPNAKRLYRSDNANSIHSSTFLARSDTFSSEKTDRCMPGT